MTFDFSPASDWSEWGSEAQVFFSDHKAKQNKRNPGLHFGTSLFQLIGRTQTMYSDLMAVLHPGILLMFVLQTSMIAYIFSNVRIINGTRQR